MYSPDPGNFLSKVLSMQLHYNALTSITVAHICMEET